MKIAWIYIEDHDPTEWKISFTQPPSWIPNVKMIVYQEVTEGPPSD